MLGIKEKPNKSPLKDDSGIQAGSMIDFYGPETISKNISGLGIETIRSQRQTCSTGMISGLRMNAKMRMSGPAIW
jgi:hypothetical protein